jgi:radical SAM protein with 4Fe4S-binding SPASM domain
MNRRRVKKAIKRISGLPLNRSLRKYLINKINHFWLRIIRSTKVAFPSTVMLELTTHCNLSCTICPREYDFGKDMDKGNMSVDQVKKVIDELFPYLDSIGLTGMGETFLYKDLEEIVDYIIKKNKGIIISLSTNGIAPDFISKASNFVNKFDTIQISVDGLDDCYDSIRKNASFKEFDANLKALSGLCQGTSTDLLLNMVVTRENYTYMPLMVQYAADTGIEYVDFTLFNLASVTGTDTSYYDFYKSDEFLKIVGSLDETSRRIPDVRVTKRDFYTASGFRKCPYPMDHFYISWNGYIPPCCAKPFPKEMNFGNVKNNRIIDLLNCEEFSDFRKLWNANITPGFCEKCHFIGIEPIKKKTIFKYS